MPANLQPITHMELLAANRKLIRLMRRRDKLAKDHDQAERDLKDQSTHVRRLIAALQPPPMPAEPICSECQHVLGSNAQCFLCRDANALAVGEPLENPENQK